MENETPYKNVKGENKMKEEIRSIGLIAIVIFLFGIIIGFTFMYQLRVQAEKRCEVLQEEVNLLKEGIIKEQK